MTSLGAIWLKIALGWATAALAKVLAAIGKIAMATMYAANVLISSPPVGCIEMSQPTPWFRRQYELEEHLRSCAVV